jgi:UDP-N-acetylmuramoyl-tripeptide--D-alanyl-D-alanine ligase
MEARSLQFVVTACAGELQSGSPAATVVRVSTDSRKTQAGDVFVALRGERFDGHDFLSDVSKRAAAVVVGHGHVVVDAGGCAVIAVDDTRKALGRLAAAYRKDFSLPLAAVAGSNGKTTTKELIASVLKQRLATLWSEASFNNDIGVPLTLLRLERSHQAAVLEVGTNHPGELEPLLRMVRADYGILTSIGREHLEFFGDLEGVVREEGWLAELLPATGKLLVSGDSAWTDRMVERTSATVVRLGLGEGNDWQASALRLGRQGLTFRVEAPNPEFTGDYRIHLLGRHQALNALFAIALGAELGLSRAEIERGLAECQPARMRLQLWESNGVRVLDDAYNANADSMLTALETLQALPCKGRRVAVLGDMAELGVHSEAAHEEVGRRAAELGIAQLFAVGKMAPTMARGARSAGLNRVFEFADVEAAAAAVKQFVKEGDVLLLKASRASRLERIADGLRSGEAAGKN